MKSMKKILAGVLVLALCMSFMSVSTLASDAEGEPSITMSALPQYGYGADCTATYQNSSGKTVTKTEFSSKSPLDNVLSAIASGTFSAASTNPNLAPKTVSVDSTQPVTITLRESVEWKASLTKKLVLATSSPSTDAEEESNTITLVNTSNNGVTFGMNVNGSLYDKTGEMTFSGGVEVQSGAKLTLNDELGGNNGCHLNYEFGSDVTVCNGGTLSLVGMTMGGQPDIATATFGDTASLIIEEGGSATIGHYELTGGSSDEALIQNSGTLEFKIVASHQPAIEAEGTAVALTGTATLNLNCGDISSSSGPAITVAKGAKLMIPEDSNAEVTTKADNAVQAIDLNDGAIIQKDDVTITVGTNSEDDNTDDNYVDNNGNIILAKGATKAGNDNEENETLNAAVILADGTIIEGSENEAPTVETTTNEDGTTTTNVTVPAGGSVTTTDGDTKTWEKGGSVESNGDTTTTTPTVSGVTLSANTLNLVYDGDNKTGTLTAALAPEGATGTVSWSSNNENVATVSNGTVTAVGVGTATITATVKDSEGTELASATCSVIVSKQPVSATGITLNKTSVTLYSNTTPNTVTLTATLTPDNSTDTVEWESNNTSVATVDANGKVTAVGNGTATITAKAGDQTATCTVTVTTYTPPSRPSYPISTPSSVDNGTVTVSPSAAKKGSTVTITATPDEGYEIAKVTVTDAKGNQLALTDKGNGKYTFVMPASKVDIDVTFQPVAVPVPPVHSFTDVAEDAWYADAVQYVFENGLMAGISDTTFAPNATTTRGMIATILYRLEREPAVSGSSPFTDVEAGLWYTDAIAWASANGVVKGYSPTTFGPNDPITREQMAAMLYRYAAYKGYDVAGKADLSGYVDADQVSSYATEAMEWANLAGLINGTSDTTLSPTASAIRAQVAAILMRFCENVVK